MNRSSSAQVARLESLEGRILFATNIEPINGVGNNLQHPTWGSTDTALLRLAPAQYADGISSPSGSSRPSARVISNTIAAHPAGDVLSSTHLAAFGYIWGQFVDHDLDLTNDGTPAETFDVAVPKGDPYFDPAGTGTQVIPLDRSEYAAGTGVTSPRQQLNDITAYMDGSMVYGSDATTAARLRTFSGGRLKTSSGNLLPFDTDGQNFLAGDVRAEENAELTSIQTLFLREHNRVAGQIVSKNPSWTDEQIYQQARRLVIGEIQQITYNEFLPALLGPGAIAPYSGYKPGVNPSISNEFSTAAYRFGHSMLTDDVEFIGNDGKPTRDAMSLSQIFFNPTIVEQNGIDPLVKYLASSNSEEIDNLVVDGVRNFLFGAPGSGGLDLASLNIQRGRDHGLADYNSTRAAMGLPRVTSFSQITSNPQLAAKLESLYGDVNNIDLWVGGLAEDHLRGSNLGPTFQRILVDQFTRVRDGDRFWYERSLNPTDLAFVRSMTLSKIIQANTTITNLQDNVFVYNTTVNGRVFADANGNGRIDPGENGLPNMTLQLVDDTGAIITTARTDPNGVYHFAGIQLGDYSVHVVTLNGQILTTPNNRPIDVTRGMDFNNVDFGIRLAQSATIGQPPPPQPGMQPLAPLPGQNDLRQLLI